MTYEDLIKSSDWVQKLNASYFESLGAKVLVFKLDKNGTKLNPIYNEEIDGRKYLRPFEIKSIYKTNPFNFNFDNTLPTETEGSLNFYFNFNVMARTMEALKKATSVWRITAEDSDWSIWKQGDFLYAYNKKYCRNSLDPLKFDLKNDYITVSELSQALTNTKYFSCKHIGDDYSVCIPNFRKVDLNNSTIVKTFNSEFKNAGNTIEQGDLIYITTINALYEVTSAYPVNNTIYRYMNWQCNAQRTFAYVEYEKLKSYGYGFNMNNITPKTATAAPNSPSSTNAPTGDETLYQIASDEDIQSIIDTFEYNN